MASWRVLCSGVCIVAALKMVLGLKIKFLPKCLFLTVFSKTYLPTKVNMLGNWEVSMLWRLFFCFISGYPKFTPYVPVPGIKVDVIIFIK